MTDSSQDTVILILNSYCLSGLSASETWKQAGCFHVGRVSFTTHANT